MLIIIFQIGSNQTILFFQPQFCYIDINGRLSNARWQQTHHVLSMRIILRTMALPGRSAATYRPRKSPIGEIQDGCTMMKVY